MGHHRSKAKNSMAFRTRKGTWCLGAYGGKDKRLERGQNRAIRKAEEQREIKRDIG